MVKYLFYTIGDLTYQSPLVILLQYTQIFLQLIMQNWVQNCAHINVLVWVQL